MKALVLVVCLGLLVYPSCSLRTPRQAADLLEEPTEGPPEEEDVFYQSPINRLATMTSNFGYSLFRQMATKMPNNNIFFSPLPVATCLSQLSLGAGSQSERVIWRVLYYHLLKDPQVHSTYKELLASLSKVNNHVKMASRIYLSKRLQAKEDFLNQVESNYGVRPKILVGIPKADLRDINEWVSQQTETQIKKFLRKFPMNPSVLLFTAAHFNGQWLTKFDPKGTKKQDFYLDQAKSVKVPMMSDPSYPVKYGFDSDLNCKIAQVPFSSNVSLLLFLPREITTNLNLIEESLTAEFLHDVVKELQDVTVTIALPKIQIRSDLDLYTALNETRLQSLFGRPDLTGVASRLARVTQVQHSAALHLSENGIQVPAATTSAKTVQLGFHLNFTVNRPFIFVLCDDLTGSLLFIGKVMDPLKFTIK
ncbi:pigment epithelium-derived factor [Latimeria chalumnae]|uniref:Serpin family F member 1 n=1 Tax=Latimeria chalumnae TaxID=7897 RepID=H2ZYD8_LATCH|nr:PREDICTED: pigment epithelium-derived factor isoform X2 [Latimeria chalumnae]|eukprot:XP_006006153.1 PREDICTED: pigment epithelium-derived factor isoform X2 [Latimeria chalumnae]